MSSPNAQETPILEEKHELYCLLLESDLNTLCVLCDYIDAQFELSRQFWGDEDGSHNVNTVTNTCYSSFSKRESSGAEMLFYFCPIEVCV